MGCLAVTVKVLRRRREGRRKKRKRRKGKRKKRKQKEKKKLTERKKRSKEKTTRYTATSCGWVGRGGNARFPTFQLEREGRMDRPTDGGTDKASYRVACPQLKRKTERRKAQLG